MKLLGSSTSPYVRKCRVAVIELGLSKDVEHLNVPPTSDEIKAANPLLKVPALVLDNGESLFDSRIILRYLNESVGGPLYPSGHWGIQRRETMAEGVLDAALLLRAENASRPEDKRWDGWIETQSTKINRALDAMEREADQLGSLDAAVIGTGCALGYLDFRFGDWGWRDGRPKLAKWFEEFNARPSMQSTMPG